MNKFSTVLKDLWALLRGLFIFALLLLPGFLAFLYWYMIDSVGLDASICAGLGVEFVWLLAFTFVVLVRDAWLDRKKRKRLDMEE